MQERKHSRKREGAKDLRLEDLLVDEEGAFDEEDEDSVTEDTLEFLSLDDEIIEEYNRSHESTKCEAATVGAHRNRDAEYEDEDYEEEDDEYEDEDYEEDDEYEYDAYEEDGVIVRFKHFLADMGTLDMVVAVLGVVVLAGVLVTGGLYANAGMMEKQVEAFASVGEEIEGISVIGEGGLIAVSESAKLANMMATEEEEQVQEEEEEEKKDTVEVTLHLTSIQSDLKIKFVNKETGKLIGSVPFEVEVTSGKKTYDLKDEDKDGIIYQTGIDSGSYQVTIKPFSGTDYEEYKLPDKASSVEVTDKIAYKKVDVADEVKTEAEVNAAAEDTAQQNTVVESVLADTVEWVESTKTPIGEGEDSYEEVPKNKIPDPWTVSSIYRKLVEEGVEETPAAVTVSLNKDSLTLKKGESESIKVQVSDSSAGYTVEWSSGDSSVATVSDGSVNGVGVGNTTITAKVVVGSMIQELSCSVTIEEADKEETKDDDKEDDEKDEDKKDDDKQEQTVITKVSISGSKEVAVGKTITLQASTEPKNGKITWNSENEKIAKVDQNGVVTGVAEGKAKIKAVCKNEGADDVSDSIEIEVKKEVTIDGSTKLKDQDGNQLYYRNSNKEYIEATYDDYGKKDTFYKKTTKVSKYKYTGWQTIDGYVYFYDKDGNIVTGEQVIQGAKYNFGSDGKLSSNSGTMGIDVSKWNGSIDWNAVKNSGVSYVIIRCGYRGSSTGALIEDPKFKSNIKGAKAAGLKVGVYFFSQAVNEVEAVEEASMAVNLVSGYGLNYPIFLDVEASGGRGDGISKETRTAVCKAFCATVQNSGYSAGIYANKTWFTEKINTASLTGYKIWLAQYASSPTYTATKYDMWQYSSTGKVSGISGKVDMNISYMNY
ncbi:MAG: Ig-like domain-containing protein [Lachnospiraceae bacterium]|nr:Ig-like domain-containing protein [Lachnospiraceae bacterium]